jgi:hypothetical protein
VKTAINRGSRAHEHRKRTTAKGFKRINFFKGFLTTEKDWNEAEQYHVEKRKLHNRLLHCVRRGLGTGRPACRGARPRRSLGRGAAGYAIDGQGNDLISGDAAIKNINPEEYRLPQTIYIVLRFCEELTDFIAYKENLEYKGHRRVLEQARSSCQQTEPDITREVELARVYLEKGAHPRARRARSARPARQRDRHALPAAGRRVGLDADPMLKQRLWAT